MSAIGGTYYPLFNKYGQFFTLFLLVPLFVYELRFCNKIVLSIFYIAFCNILISPIFTSYGYFQSLLSNTFILNIFLGYVLFINKSVSCKLLYVILIANGIAILLETFFHVNIVEIAEGYDTPTIRFLYKFGLFSAPKTGAFFIIAVSLLAFLNKNLKILFLGVFISVFTGVRISTVCLLVSLVYLLFKYSSYKTNTKVFILLFFLISAVTLVFSFYDEYGAVFERLLTSLDVEDGSNQLRFYYWKLHWSFFWKQSIEHIIYGDYGKADSFFGNGAECAFLDLMNNGGLISFFLFLYPLMLILRKSNMYNWIFCFLVFITMLSGRYSVGFSDGIVYWFTIFCLLEPQRCNVY